MARGEYSRIAEVKELRDHLQSDLLLLLADPAEENTKEGLKKMVSQRTGVPVDFISVHFAKDKILICVRPPLPMSIQNVYMSLSLEVSGGE